MKPHIFTDRDVTTVQVNYTVKPQGQQDMLQRRFTEIGMLSMAIVTHDDVDIPESAWSALASSCGYVRPS
jgi:hypothetical protein